MSDRKEHNVNRLLGRLAFLGAGMLLAALSVTGGALIAFGAEELDALSRELGVTGATLARWRERFLGAGQAALKNRPEHEGDEEVRRLQARVGEITRESELLRQRARAAEVRKGFRAGGSRRRARPPCLSRPPRPGGSSLRASRRSVPDWPHCRGRIGHHDLGERRGLKSAGAFTPPYKWHTAPEVVYYPQWPASAPASMIRFSAGVRVPSCSRLLRVALTDQYQLFQ